MPTLCPANTLFAQDWTLDGLGNWTEFDDDGAVEERAHNAANEIESMTPDGQPPVDGQANEDTRDAGELGPNHLERWQTRTAITSRERHGWLLTVARLNDQIDQQMDTAAQQQLTAAQQAAIERRVIRRACVELGLLSVTRRLFTLPLRPKHWAKIS